jgi:hypothetical protein
VVHGHLAVPLATLDDELYQVNEDASSTPPYRTSSDLSQKVVLPGTGGHDLLGIGGVVCELPKSVGGHLGHDGARGTPIRRSHSRCDRGLSDDAPRPTCLFSVGDWRRGVRERQYGIITLRVALLVMGFPGAVECCNHIAVCLKAGLQANP